MGTDRGGRVMLVEADRTPRPMPCVFGRAIQDPLAQLQAQDMSQSDRGQNRMMPPAPVTRFCSAGAGITKAVMHHADRIIMIISPPARLRAEADSRSAAGTSLRPRVIFAPYRSLNGFAQPRATASGSPALSATSADCVWRGGLWHQGKMARRGDELVIGQYGPGAERRRRRSS